MKRWLVGLLLFAGCSGVANPANPAGSQASGAELVLHGSEMSGTLLDALQTHFPAMKVGSQSNGCPALQFRGAGSVRTAPSPSVYVDGTRMVDTCILAQMSTTEIDSVEVYPSGNTAKAAVPRNPSGMIFIYRVRR